jgi:hypothetical protein
MNRIILFISAVLISSVSMASTKADHSKWNKLLQMYVSDNGSVDYKGFKKDAELFDQYLIELREHAPMKDWTKAERKAFYINAYNAYTVKFILTKYPVSSPKDVKFSGKDMWNFRMVQIGPQKYNLQQVEDNILRRMGDPRIHFAINCGAKSCPKLLNEAYVPEKLNAQLTKVTKEFIQNKSHNQLSEKKIKISKIFEWYAEDFNEGSETLISFLNKYSGDLTIRDDAKVEYLEYNWNLNE